MADIVGLVASVLQLIDNLVKARGHIHDFLNVPKDQQRLVLEIRNLEPLIRKLDARIKGLQAAGLISSVQEFEEPLGQLNETVQRITTSLNRAGVVKIVSRVTWVLWGKEDIEKELVTIERFKSLLNAWLAMDSWNCTQGILSVLKDGDEERRIDQSYIAKSVRDVARTQDSAERDKLIDWFSPLNFFLRQGDIFSTRQPETGEWLLEHKLFKEWTSGQGRPLWCVGMPGAGKTVLASIVVEHLREGLDQRSLGVAAMYLDHQETEAQCLSSLLAGLWRQLAVQKPISPAVSRLYEKHRERRTRPSLTEIDSILCSALSEHSKVFIIVDALDEYPERQRYILLRHLASLARMPNVNLMLTSRPHLNISQFFQDLDTLEIRAMDDDIRRYVEAEILKSPHLSKHIEDRPNLRGEIETIVVQRSDGMFLLAKLHIDSLTTKLTIKAVRETLAKMPDDLNSTYDQVVERINLQSEDAKNLAWRTISWVTHAERPLRPSELREALAVEMETTVLDPDNRLEIETILSVCAGLVVINPGDRRIRLVHHTMQSYFNAAQAATLPHHASTEITMTCITYLSFDIFSEHVDDPINLFYQYPFLDYAVEYCLVNFLGRSSAWWTLWNWKHGYDKRRKSGERLWVAAAFHLSEICRHLINEDAGGASQGVLANAALEGLTDMVQALIDNGLNPNTVSPEGTYASALQCAASRGHADIIKFLLDHGANIDLATRDAGTALQIAAFFGQKDSICLLILRGASVNAQSGWYGTALVAAAYRNNYDIVKILLEHGADINLRSKDFGSAIEAASSAGHRFVCDLLIEHGATPLGPFMNVEPSLGADTPREDCLPPLFCQPSFPHSRQLQDETKPRTGCVSAHAHSSPRETLHPRACVSGLAYYMTGGMAGKPRGTNQKFQLFKRRN